MPFLAAFVCALLLAFQGIGFARDDVAPHVPGQLLVKFASGVDETAVRSVLAHADRSIAARSGGAAPRMALARRFDVLSRHVGAECWLLETSGDLDTTIAQLRSDPSVAAVSRNWLRTSQALPDDPDLPLLWGLNNSGQVVAGETGLQGADISALHAWRRLRKAPGQGVVVAVVDNGARVDHPDLAANMWVNTLEIPDNGLDDDGNGYVDDIHGIDALSGATGTKMEFGEHGTHVAGIVGAVAGNGIGIAGVAWGARIMSLRYSGASGEGTDEKAIECIEYAIAMRTRDMDPVNVRVLNASWGGAPYNSLLRDALAASGEVGILSVIASGNYGSDNDASPIYPASYDLPDILAVASTDNKDGLSSTSNYGLQSVDLAAPGSAIWSTIWKQVYTPSIYHGQQDVFYDNMSNGSGAWLASSEWQLEEIFPGYWWWNYHAPASPSAQHADLELAAPLDLSETVGHELVLFAMADGMFFKSGNCMELAFSADDGATWTTVASFVNSLDFQRLEHWVVDDAYKSSRFRLRLRITDTSDVDARGSLEVVALGVPVVEKFQYKSGTSMAAPHVAGAAAAVASLHPSETAEQIKARLLAGVDPLPSLAGKTLTGGRLNLLRALGLPPVPPAVLQLLLE